MTFLPLLRCEKCCKNIKIGDYKIFKFFANANYVRPPSEDVRCPFSIAMNTPLAIVWYGQAHCTCIRITQKLTPGHAIFLNHGFLIGVGIVHRYEVYISILRWREGISINYGDRCINFVTQGLFPDSSLSPSPPPPTRSLMESKTEKCTSRLTETLSSQNGNSESCGISHSCFFPFSGHHNRSKIFTIKDPKLRSRKYTIDKINYLPDYYHV